MNTRWRIELLGNLRAQAGGRLIDRFHTQKAALLLAYLAYHVHRAHPRDVLIDLLWPEADPQAGRNSLSVALSSLRHQLEPPGTPAGAVLLADRATVRLHSEAVTTDVHEFEAALQAAERAGSRTERVQALVQAVELYRGELLAGSYEEWVLQERGWLAERYFQALGQLIAELEAVGERTRPLEYAQRGVRADPLREEAHREVIRLLGAAGQLAAAERQYRELERRLKEDLGATPAPSTRALLRELEGRSAAGQRLDARASSPGPDQTTAASPSVAAAHDRALLSPLPTGTVTFLLTDIEGSTALWERGRDHFQSALEAHHALLRQLFRQHGGCEFKEMGDAFLVAFERAADALACAGAAQQALAAHPWPDAVGPLRVRIALHTGDITPQEGDYHGPVLNCAQRVLAAGHGGQILCSEATAVLLRRDLEPGVRLKELGVYRLRDVAQPERLFQVEYPGMLQAEFPPLKAEAGYASHLPLSLTRFFGREQEVELLGKLLVSGEWRLVTLMGTGGSGKTRLALEVARRVVDAWQGAIWFVSLADLTDPGRIASRVRDALRLPPSTTVEPREQVVDALARQPSLLVLDNFEHLVEEGAVLLQTFLERVPSLTLLVTSRQRLNLSGEREFLVSPLPTPRRAEAPEQLVQWESVQLFVDRAQGVRPEFQVTARNAGAVAALCERLEGLPLALELAAARAQVLTPSQMLAQLERRFELLASRQRDLAERHRSLRGALEWSYRLLAPELRRFFARLSVFRGGWSLEAAEAVCEEPLALDYLAQLRECSLVLVQETDSHLSDGGEMRFRLLETLREYGWEQLEAAERAERERRHAEHFLDLAEAAAPGLTGAEQGEWLERLEREHDNLREALTWLVRHAETEMALRLGAALGLFWLMRGYLGDGRDWLAQVIAVAGALGAPSLRAKVLNSAGALAYRQGDYDSARTQYEESLAIRRALGDPQGVAGSLNNLGLVAQDQGDYEAARSFHEQSLALMRELGNRGGISQSLNNLGMLVHAQGEYAMARSLLEESLAIQRQLDNRQGIAFALNNLANVVLDEGDFESARRLHEESLGIKRELGDAWGIASSLHNLAMVALDQGDYEAARSSSEEGLAIRRELGDRRGIADSLYGMARLARLQGEGAVARSLYEESLMIRREMGDRKGTAEALNGLGSLAWAEHRYDEAHSLHQESLALRRELGDKPGIAASLHNLGSLAAARGDYERAQLLHREGLALRRELGDEPGIIDSLTGIAWAARSQEQFERAACLLAAAQRLRDVLGAPFPPADRPAHEQMMAEVRAALGEAAFTTAWVQGQTMPLEQIIGVASE